MKAYLVDDEPLALRRLERMLVETGRVSVLGSSTDPGAASAAITSLHPDVLFLDIEMPGLTGFDLLAHLPHPPLVVFTTAYPQYALDAFEASSIDYLLKPIRPEALDRALSKLEKMLASPSPPAVSDLLLQVQQALRSTRGDYPARIASRTGDKVEFIDLASVAYFYARDKLTYAAAVRHHVIDQTISELEAQLDPRRWLRIHRATLVQIEYVKELHPGVGGRAILRLKDGRTDLQVARERVPELRAKLGI